MKKKKITGKQIKLIFNIVSLSIFIFSYFYLYEHYVDKEEKARKDIETVRTDIRVREKKLAEEDSIRERIAEVNAQKQEIINSFPPTIKDEDNFMFIEEMEEALKIRTSSVTPSESTLFFETILPADVTKAATAATTPAADTIAGDSSAQGNNGTVADGAQGSTKNGQTAGDKNKAAAPVVTATVNTLSMSFMTDYKGLKNIAEYIRKYPDHTIIDSISVSADSTTGILAGNLVLKRFALSGINREYVEPSIEGIDIGTDNIFGAD